MWRGAAPGVDVRPVYSQSSTSANFDIVCHYWCDPAADNFGGKNLVNDCVFHGLLVMATHALLAVEDTELGGNVNSVCDNVFLSRRNP